MYIQWLRDGLNRPGKTQRGLAAKLNVSESVVSRMLKGERKILAAELDIIASYLGEPPPSHRTENERRPVSTVQVTRIAAPGVWREVGFTMLADRTLLPSNPDAKYVHARQFAVQIEGTRRYAICIEHNPAQSLHHGELVVVERRQGSLVETTIRRVEVTQNGIKVAIAGEVPSSADIIHSIDEVSIIGRVTGFFEPA